MHRLQLQAHPHLAWKPYRHGRDRHCQLYQHSEGAAAEACMLIYMKHVAVHCPAAAWTYSPRALLWLSEACNLHSRLSNSPVLE